MSKTSLFIFSLEEFTIIKNENSSSEICLYFRSSFDVSLCLLYSEDMSTISDITPAAVASPPAPDPEI